MKSVRWLWVLVLVASPFIGRVDALASPSDTTLTPGQRLTVQVYDPAGRPVAGAIVKMDCVVGTWHRGFDPGSITNQDGLAKYFNGFKCDAGGILGVVAHGWAPINVPIEQWNVTMVVRLLTGASLNGRVSRNGAGIPGVQVRVMRKEGTLPVGEFDGEAVTDEKGNYRIDHLEPLRRYWVFVPMNASREFGAFRAESLQAGPDSAVTTAPELRWEEGRTISGRVTLPPEAHAAKAESCRVRLVRMIDDPHFMSPTGHDAVFARVDHEGRFNFSHVPQDGMWIRAELFGFLMSKSLHAPLHEYLFGAARLDPRGDKRDLVLPMLVDHRSHEPTIGDLKNR